MVSSVDMLLLSHASMFVGKFSSNFFRAAYALHAARCECAAPFVSLDAPWCFDYGLAEGRNWDFPTPYRGNASALLATSKWGRPNTLQC